MSRYGHLVCITVAILSATAGSSTWAAIRPSFSLDYSAWKATHIVLATEGSALDGRLEVIESWKGDVAPGAQLTLPALAVFADEGKRQVYWWHRRDLPEPYVRSVTGARMVLFLIRTNSPPQAVPSGPAPNLWRPANWDDTWGSGTFVAWIERGEVYAYIQVLNPGPSRLVRHGSATEMKARIASLISTQAELHAAVHENDPTRVVKAFRALVRGSFAEAARESLDSLGKMGDRSLPTLRLLLHDPTVQAWHPYVISALVAAGGQAARPDVVGVVEEELGFWSKESPRLKDGWWNAEPADQRESRRDHYGRLLQALRSLATPIDVSERSIVTKTRDLWQTTAALAGVGDGQIADACDALLKEPLE